MNEEPTTVSLSLRLRRTTYEDAYVTVPVSETIAKVNEDGTLGIHVEAFLAEAIRLSNDPRVQWKLEERQTEPHPVQQQHPEDR